MTNELVSSSNCEPFLRALGIRLGCDYIRAITIRADKTEVTAVLEIWDAMGETYERSHTLEALVPGEQEAQKALCALLGIEPTGVISIKLQLESGSFAEATYKTEVKFPQDLTQRLRIKQ